MNIDRARLKEVVESANTVLGFWDIPFRNDNRWDPGAPGTGSAGDLIARYLNPGDRILDLGCGRGHILMEICSSFQSGLGIDKDAKQIQKAEAAKRKNKIQNVDFMLLDFPRQAGRLESESFDMVISIRGALDETDESVQAAYSLLCADGLLFSEEIGELHNIEAVEIFEDNSVLDDGKTVLQKQREIFERNGFEVRLAADILGKMVFQDIYTWFQYQCNLALEFGGSLPDPDDPRIALYAARNTLKTGEVVLTWHCPWIGCVKK